MKVQIGQKVVIAVLLSMVSVGLLGWMSIAFIQEIIVVSRHNARSHQVLFVSERIRSTLLDVIMRPDDSAVAKRAEMDGAMEDYLMTIDSLVLYDSLQGMAVDTLRATWWKLQESRRSDTTVFPGTPLMALERTIDRIQLVENRLRTERQGFVTRLFYRFVAVSAGLLVLWLVIMVALVVVLRRNLRRRVQAEGRLKLAAAEIFDLYDHAPCGYFTLNGDGMFVDANRTLLRWSGYDKTGVVDRMRLENMLSFDGKFSLVEFGGGTEGHVEGVLMRKDGSKMPVVVNYIHTRDSKGQTCYRCSVTDHTDRKKAEDEIRRTNEELEAFTYSVSHDLRAPLRSIHGYAQILLEDYGDKVDREGARVIEVIMNNGKKMGQLIDDLLDFSRTSRKDIVHSLIRMDDYVRPVAWELVAQEPGRTIELTIHVLAPARGDVSMMKQVWVNLLSNALKYTRKREVATIEVGCVANAGETVYYVKDNGAGFDMKYYDKLFGVFQRLHKAEDFEGTGVGLALVKRIIDRHHGRIWAESRVDGGSTFYFSVPAPVVTQGAQVHQLESE